MFKNLYLSGETPLEIANENADYAAFNEKRTSFLSSIALTLAFTAYTAATVGRLIVNFLKSNINDNITMGVSLFVTLVLLASFVLLYLNKCKGNIEQRRGRFMRLLLRKRLMIQSVVVIGIAISVGLRLFSRIYVGQCLDYSLGHMIDCNPNQTTRGLPQDSTAVAMLIPIVYSLALKDIKWEIVVISWLITTICMVASVIYINASSCIIMLIIYIPTSLFIIYDTQRQNIEMFNLTQKKDQLLRENERMAEEVHATEMRHMIGNVAHDLKTPLTSFLTGIEFISGCVTADFDKIRGDYGEILSEISPSSPSPSLLPFLDRTSELMGMINNAVCNMKNTNSFMIMTINRCIDYTKASNGLKLVPKLETISLMDTLSLPMKVMRDMQTKIEIQLRPISKEICSHIITDEQWLQENILCLLSNAVKYSGRGLVTITISLLKPAPVDVKERHPLLKGLTAAFSSRDNNSNRSLSVNNNNSKRVLNIKVHPQQEICEEDTLLQDVLDDDIESHLVLIPAPSVHTTVSRSPSNKSRSAQYSPMTLTTASLKAAAAGTNSNKLNNINNTENGNHNKSIANTSDKEKQQANSAVNGVKSSSSGKSAKSHAESNIGSNIGSDFSAAGGSDKTREEGANMAYLKIEIEDTGIGLSDEAMSNLFNPFKQAQRLAGGTGLGLYSMAKRIEALKGDFGVLKRIDGEQGSNFWFTIPYRPDRDTSKHTRFLNRQHANSTNNNNNNLNTNSAHTAPLTPHSQSQSAVSSDRVEPTQKAQHNLYALSMAHNNNHSNTSMTSNLSGSPQHHNNNGRPKLKILLVDDAISILKMTGMMLRRQGHTVEQAENGVEALDLLLSKMNQLHTPAPLINNTTTHNLLNNNTTNNTTTNTTQGYYDVVLMDLQMPVMDGLEATRRLRKREMKSNSISYNASFTLSQREEGEANSVDSKPPSRRASSYFKIRRHQIIIGVSANSDNETMEEAMAAGFDAFISKPFSMDSFYETYSRLLSIQQLALQQNNSVYSGMLSLGEGEGENSIIEEEKGVE